MSEVKHTPGPWRCVRSVTCGHLRAAHNHQTDPRAEWTDADMRLIDAAPDLLAACLAVVTEYEAGAMVTESLFRRLARRCVTAVAKATDQQ